MATQPPTAGGWLWHRAPPESAPDLVATGNRLKRAGQPGLIQIGPDISRGVVDTLHSSTNHDLKLLTARSALESSLLLYLAISQREKHAWNVRPKSTVYRFAISAQDMTANMNPLTMKR